MENVKIINKENAKVMRTATVLDRIFKILQGFAIAAMIVAVIFSVLTGIFGDKIIADASTLSLGAAKLSLAGDRAEYINSPLAIGSIIAMLGEVFIIGAGTWCGLRMLRGILAPMKEGEVFAEGISKKVRMLGWTVLIWGGVAEIMSRVSSVLELRAYNADALFNRTIVEEIDYGAQISPWFVIAALVLFFLSFIFSCGERLQKESDETL